MTAPGKRAFPVPTGMQEWIGVLLQQVEDAADRGAARGAARALEAQRPSKLDLPELAALLKKSVGATRVFLSRHRDFPRERAGKRLLFSRDAVAAWLARNEKA